MAGFERIFSEDQKEAATHAYLDRGIRPARRVIQLAAEGNLITRDGRKVPPCTINPKTFPSWVTNERKRRLGKIKGVALERPDDVLEGLRRRMISVADSELDYVERQKKGKRDPEHLRQIARLVREVAALPGPKENRPVAPGQRVRETHNGGDTGGGIAGKLLAAHRTATAPEPLTAPETQTENTDASATTRSDTEHNEDRAAVPGSWQRSLVGRSVQGTDTRIG